MPRPAAITMLLLSVLLLASGSAHAVNFYDGARAKEGLYFLTYSSLYLADELTDYKGNTTKTHYDLTKFDETLRLAYYTPEFVVTGLVPAGYTDIRSQRQFAYGMGDVSLGVGGFLPIKSVDILPMLFVKIPTGAYDATKSANLGSNQYDIRPVVFLYKGFGDFSIDAVAKYFIRLRNTATDVSPGDEFHLQGLLGYSVTDRFKFGPSVSWMVSQEKEQNGIAIANSARQTLSMGADVYYRFSNVGITLTYLYDVHAENSTKGHFFQIKTVYRF
jgi:hypothetical protein